MGSLDDYRLNTDESPVIWCLKCKHMRLSTDKTVVIKTVFRVTEHGIYPFGVCEDCHESDS